MLSKDDNLLLLVGGLFHSIFSCNVISKELWDLAPEIAIHLPGEKEEKEKKQLTEEEEMMMMMGNQVASKEDFVNALL